MTNDELERIINFIVESPDASAEQLERAETILTTLAERHMIPTERQENHEQRIARFERSHTLITGLLEKHDTQIEALTEGRNNLVATVNRYITARGDGSNGSGGA
ncbi:MAG: hypothetical protein H0V88_07260 [Pyrinomonadaceae bacterium]|nr:hypothetical protein [Pyrinomonadaceae bacterium]